MEKWHIIASAQYNHKDFIGIDGLNVITEYQ
jgi:hypothetical protein